MQTFMSASFSFIQLSKLFKRFHYVVAEGFAGCACVAAGDNQLLFLKGTNVESAFQLICSILVSDMGEKHYRYPFDSETVMTDYR